MATENPATELPDPGPPVNYDDHIGNASMLDDGTLHMQLRTVASDGTIGEMLMVVTADQPEYGGYVTHLGGIQPGEHKSIPPF